MTGFVAATAHRGIRHIRMPSTVLSQNDSGVGVKNGINYKGLKNFVGSFTPPWAVLNDFDLLGTLSPRDRISGFAEAVKVALIRDKEFFLELEEMTEELIRFEPIAVERMIRRCAELHMTQIANSGDPFETGTARPLDFGHWAAHRLEGLTNYSLTHGEAVAIGIALDTYYSVLMGFLKDDHCERIVTLLQKLNFTLWNPMLKQKKTSNPYNAILSGLQEFREHLGGNLTITLLSNIGHGIEVNSMDTTSIIKAINWLEERFGV